MDNFNEPWYAGPTIEGEYGQRTVSIGPFPIGPGTEYEDRDTHIEDTICEVWLDNNRPDTARRIVACINACSRIPTETLERHGVDQKELRIALLTEIIENFQADLKTLKESDDDRED
jgi:uncharacterized small protein (DUF1192 family)